MKPPKKTQAKKRNYSSPKIKGKPMTVVYNFRFEDLGSNLFPVVLACGEQLCCLLPGTQITMADGTTKAIERLSAGSLLLSYDLMRNEITTDTVIDTYSIYNSHGYITINERLRITDKHPLLVNGIWAKPDAVREGDTLLTYEGKLISVQKLQKTLGTHKVYNLHTEKNQGCYFADGILVKDYYGVTRVEKNPFSGNFESSNQ